MPIGVWGLKFYEGIPMATVAVRPAANRWLDLIWKTVIISFGYLVGTIILGVVIEALGLPMPTIASRLDPQQALVATLLSGFVYGLVMGPLSQRLPIPTGQRVGVLFLLAYGLNSVLNGLEAVFFSTYVAADQFVTLLVIGVSHLAPAALAAVLFPPREVTTTLGRLLRETLAARSLPGWTWRFLLAGVLFVPIYLFFGSLIAPIVVPYYTDAAGTGLAIPSFGVMIPLEVIRGLLFIPVVFPVVMVLRGSRLRLALWLGLILAAFVGWAPLLGGSFLPLTLRVVHGLEITADAFVHGALIAWLLGVGTRK